MELIDIIPEFNLYEEYWKIYTNSGILPPHYISDQSAVEKSIIGNGCDIYGEVHSSVISSGVTIGKEAFAVPVYHSLLVLFSYGGSTVTPPTLRSKSHGIPIPICVFRRNG